VFARGTEIATTTSQRANSSRQGASNDGDQEVLVILQGQSKSPQGHEGTQRGQTQVRQRQEGQESKTSRGNSTKRSAKGRRESPQKKEQLTKARALGQRPLSPKELGLSLVGEQIEKTRAKVSEKACRVSCPDQDDVEHALDVSA